MPDGVDKGRLRSSREDIWTWAGSTDEWPKPVIDDLPELDKVAYLRARNAVTLWTQNERMEEIAKKTGVSPSKTLRLVRRCVAINPATKQICGFWACVPGWASSVPKRVRSKEFDEEFVAKGSGMSGILDELFREFPKLHKNLCDYVRTRTESGAAPVAALTVANVHERFIALCKDERLHTQGRWPFNDVKRSGYEAVRRWFRKEQRKAPLRASSNEFGDEAAKLANIDFHT
ncbi:hypothetical protein ACQUZK_09220, partial [Streptococcus pyogenes]|uniref:hypothetical protein n=1 Tax=Streptococcus pyogenes TaxID=1314 RepID=UPI003DA165E2